MLYIATTRFNNETWNQNERWRMVHEWEGCVYGTPMRMKDDIPLGSAVVILEMNNEENKIMGLGLVENKLALDRRYNIYKWGNYNRFTYKGKHRIDREDLEPQEQIVVRVLELLVFKGYRHLKRGQGITTLPSWIIRNKQIDFRKEIASMFTRRTSVSRKD
jgi:hypothetical protein